MPINNYQKMCYRKFRSTAENIVNDKMKQNLEKAHIDIRPDAYLSYVWMNTILAAVVSSIIYISLLVFLRPFFILTLLLLSIPILTTILVYFYFMSYPGIKAKARGKKIDMHLSYALNFISAMSSAGITPTEIFKSLSKQKIYGEIREESLWIYRDVGLLGKDIISALKANIERTPSEKFKEFLQGAIITIQSGGALKPYFMSKAEQYSRENRIAQKQLLESLGIMAEAYVTAAVAGILLIIIIIPLMMLISSADSSQLIIIYIFSFIVIPLINISFAFVLASMSQRV
ncbi:MAG: type II secretion system F family protein [Candidatus Thermoplasmatota archaeon]|nr:type II secretion system F family protein [Candidatus Thermoplasmatota archaeon]